MNVNISNEFNFSVVHGAMNRSGSLANLTGYLSFYVVTLSNQFKKFNLIGSRLNFQMP